MEKKMNTFQTIVYAYTEYLINNKNTESLKSIDSIVDFVNHKQFEKALSVLGDYYSPLTTRKDKPNIDIDFVYLIKQEIYKTAINYHTAILNDVLQLLLSFKHIDWSGCISFHQQKYYFIPNEKLFWNKINFINNSDLKLKHSIVEIMQLAYSHNSSMMNFYKLQSNN